LGEFHDWYNNEHIPLRLDHLPAFLTGARYVASDGNKPSWIALYDITSTSTFSDPSYTRLRENRSPREAALVKRLDVLDRRTCELVFETEGGYLGKGETLEAPITGFAPGNPTPWLFTHGIDIITASGRDVDEAISEVWYAITVAGVGVNGLIRSRLFKCTDSLKTGTSISSNPEEQRVPQYFVLHELASKLDFETLRVGLGDSKNNGIFTILEEREWEVYRAYPCIAQGNLP